MDIEDNWARDTIKHQGRRASNQTERETKAKRQDSATGTKAAFIRELTT
jgi:hypothetical protein